MSKGRKGTRQVHQIGGSTTRDVVSIPELHLRVDTLATALRPATVFSKPVGNDLQHGNLGFDALSRAAEVVIDFQAMSSTVR